MDCVETASPPPHLAHDVASFSSRLLSRVSIVIPIAPDDETWRLLIDDLADTGTGAELLLVGINNEPSDFREFVVRHGAFRRIQWLTTTAGRAHQMNYGARFSASPFIWLLHADSRVTVDALLALEESLDAQPRALHYFDVIFQDDGPRLVCLNVMGVRFRSRCLGLPFGDQGFCISREIFDRLGGFDEAAAYGEDHLLIWAARSHRVPLQRVGAVIATSARKYRTNGWFKITLLHGWRTWRQAVPQFFRFLVNRCR